MSKLDELEKLSKAATPGPWQTRFMYRSLSSARKDSSLLIETPASQDWTDAELIAAMRNNIEALIKVARAAEGVWVIRNLQTRGSDAWHELAVALAELERGE